MAQIRQIDPVVASYKDYGFVAAVPKPFTLNQVAETLSSVLTAVP